ncbi:arylesterase, partial [Legionella tunisiensis]|uniref:arylesterase n=1 Tax=Legionella tunisiensis TaxID=1034944 RepID=UPI00035D0133
VTRITSYNVCYTKLLRTSNGLAKLPPALQTYHPAFLLLQLGANDGLRGLSLAQMKSNLAKIIEMSQKANVKVLLIATQLPPNYGPIYLKKFKLVYSDLAKQYNIPLIPMFLEGVAGNPAFMQKDGLHPNQQAQSKIMANVWATLAPMLNKK